MSADKDPDDNIVPIRGMRPPRDPQITTLWDDKRYDDEFLAKIHAIMQANADLWFIEVRDSKGRELLMFRGSHP